MRLHGITPERAYKASEIKQMRETTTTAADAPPVIRKIHRAGAVPDPMRGLFLAQVDSEPVVVEYEPDKDLRDTEQVPLLEENGIEGFLEREVLPYAPDAWYVPGSVKIGYEISFTRYFYKPPPLRAPGRDLGRHPGYGRGDRGVVGGDYGWSSQKWIKLICPILSAFFNVGTISLKTLRLRNM